MSVGSEGVQDHDLRLDVSELAPPEPLVRILAAVDSLGPGQALRVRHRREPFPLYQALAESGFVHRTSRLGPDRYEILIWRADDEAANARLGPPDPPS